MIWPFRKRLPVVGDLKRLEDSTLSDLETYPIRVNDLSGEGVDGFDETSTRPVIACTDVTREMLKRYLEVSVAIRIADSDLRGCANVERDLTLSCIVVWREDEWTDPGKIAGFPSGAEIHVVPTIQGYAKAYRHIPGTDRAE